MTTLEIEAKITSIISDVNSEDKLKQPPCRYSVTELNERAQKAINDYETGKKLIPHEQIKRKERFE
jgi:hypothetical protein